MQSDEDPFSIVNVACHGCQDEMRSTSDTHEWETRQLVLCIFVSTIFRIFFVWMWMTGFQVYHYRGRWWFLKSQKNLFVQAHDFLKFHFSDNYWPKIILQVKEVCVLIMFNQPVWYLNALVHHSWVILQTIWEALGYLMTLGIQSVIILTSTWAVGTLLESGQCKASRNLCAVTKDLGSLHIPPSEFSHSFLAHHRAWNWSACRLCSHIFYTHGLKW